MARRALAASIDAVVACSEVWVAVRLTWAWLYCSSAWSRTACCWEIWASRAVTWASAASIEDCADEVVLVDEDEDGPVVVDVEVPEGAAPAIPEPDPKVSTATRPTTARVRPVTPVRTVEVARVRRRAGAVDRTAVCP